ncbi:MAG: hypothetical protein RIG62_03555 [Cyclobacteriaceae bacterium]
MVIKRIFEVVTNSLLSVHYQGKKLHEFARLFKEWQDVAYLEEFFETHRSDLQSGFYGDMSVEDAVFATLDEAEEFEEYMVDVATEGKKDPDYTLYDKVFHPLHTYDTSTKLLESKAYSGARNSWLRIYAIRIANNLYVVTGGAIKLTKAMQDRPHTEIELKKLKIVSQYLKELGVESADDYGFIDIQNDEG